MGVFLFSKPNGFYTDLRRPATAIIAIDILQTLTGFEVFDCLAAAGREPDDVARVVQRLALAAIGAMVAGLATIWARSTSSLLALALDSAASRK
jgi:hypothetical protein